MKAILIAAGIIGLAAAAVLIYMQTELATSDVDQLEDPGRQLI